MEIFFSILCAIFAVISCIFGVRNRISNSRTGAGSDIRNSRERLDNTLSDYQQLERDEERVQELERRSADNIAECSRISERIRKREPETNVTE